MEIALWEYLVRDFHTFFLMLRVEWNRWLKRGWSGCIVAQSLHFEEHLQIMTEDVAFI